MKALIAQKYDAVSNDDKYAIFFELRSSTGGARGAIDAFVMNVWPSGKFARMAFEIKVSRADMMHELARPEKRGWSMDISNEFWFVCAPGIVEVNEIPENCGLMVATKNAQKLIIKKRAQWREAADLKPGTIASIIRSASRMQNFPSTLLWKLDGREIGSDELDEVINSRRDDSDKRRLFDRATEYAQKMFDDQNYEMREYAEIMREAGIEPPGFMSTSRGFHYRHVVENWVEEHLVVGPDVHQLRTAMAELKRAELAMKAAKDNIMALAEGKQKDSNQEVIK